MPTGGKKARVMAEEMCMLLEKRGLIGTRISKTSVIHILPSMNKAMANVLARDKKLFLPGLGIFRTYYRKLPNTMVYTEKKYVVAVGYRPNRRLKDLINK